MLYPILSYLNTYYYLINLFTWYLLMHQIEIMSEIRNGVEYQECK